MESRVTRLHFESQEGLTAVIEFDEDRELVVVDVLHPERKSAITASIVWKARKNECTDHVYIALLPVSVSDRDNFDQWFTEEHGPRVLSATSWASAMLASSDSGIFSRVGIHFMSDLDALDSPERKAAGETDWTKEIMSAGWSSGIERFIGTRRESRR